jgi:hypothetical protein
LACTCSSIAWPPARPVTASHRSPDSRCSTEVSSRNPRTCSGGAPRRVSTVASPGRNRLDRVFTCKRYTVRSGYGDADLDMLYAELSDRDIDTMPRLDPD